MLVTTDNQVPLEYNLDNVKGNNNNNFSLHIILSDTVSSSQQAGYIHLRGFHQIDNQ